MALARKHVGDVEFSAEDGGRTPVEYLIQVAQAVVAAGASTVNIPDTVGYGIPEEYGALIGQVARALGSSAIVSVHCHNDLGLAVANSLAAVQNGARQVECTINGIGERAGNCSLEEIVMVLKTRGDRLPYVDRHPHRAALSGQPAADGDHRRRRPAEQGHRRAQRLRARGRHPPGRLPQGADHLRDHRAEERRRAREPPGARQAQRPPRAEGARSAIWACRSTRHSSTSSTPGSRRWPTRKKGITDEEIRGLAQDVVSEGHQEK